MENQLAHIDQPAYSVCRTRRAPILVCPHCKRLLNGISSSGSKGFCDEHGEVTPMNSAVVNTHNYG